MKEKLLNSYKAMEKFLKEKNYNMVLLKEDKTYNYVNKKGENIEFKISRGTTILDCPEDIMAKVLDMHSKINTAYVKGIITMEDITKTIEEIYEGC